MGFSVVAERGLSWACKQAGQGFAFSIVWNQIDLPRAVWCSAVNPLELGAWI